jgi:hypothetical protein
MLPPANISKFSVTVRINIYVIYRLTPTASCAVIRKRTRRERNRRELLGLKGRYHLPSQRAGSIKTNVQARTVEDDP